jgi:hypothetical protein
MLGLPTDIENCYTMKEGNLMDQTKYNDLQNASTKMRNSYKDYEKECREFIRELLKGLIQYLGCDQKDIVWLRYDAPKNDEELKKNNIMEITPERLLILYNDAYYGFVLRIKFEAQSVDTSFKVKINGGKIFLHIGDVTKEINKNNPEEFNKLFKEIYNLTKLFLENNFEEFINNKSKRALGFKLSE